MSYNPAAFGAQGINQFSPGTILGSLGGALIRGYMGSTASSGRSNTFIDEGANIDVLSQREAQAAGLVPKKRRRRRRRLLTCGDKADIAFLHGQLGGGALGRAAISSLLSRRCG